MPAKKKNEIHLIYFELPDQQYRRLQEISFTEIYPLYVRRYLDDICLEALRDA